MQIGPDEFGEFKRAPHRRALRNGRDFERVWQARDERIAALASSAGSQAVSPDRAAA